MVGGRFHWATQNEPPPIKSGLTVIRKLFGQLHYRLQMQRASFKFLKIWLIFLSLLSIIFYEDYECIHDEAAHSFRQSLRDRLTTSFDKVQQSMFSGIALSSRTGL